MMCKIMGIFSDVGRYGYKSLSVEIRFAISMMEASYFYEFFFIFLWVFLHTDLFNYANLLSCGKTPVDGAEYADKHNRIYICV